MNTYKVIVNGNNVYKEIELLPDASVVTLGTELGSDYRLLKENFFNEIKITFTNNNGQWSLFCDDNAYVDDGGINKVISRELNHGDLFKIRYQDSNALIFDVEFIIDFNNENRKYSRCIDISNKNVLKIGAPNECEISFRNELVTDDYVVLQKASNNSFNVSNIHSKYGFYVNGNKVDIGTTILENDFFSLSNYSFYYKKNELWTDIRPEMRFNGLDYKDDTKNNNYPKFNRNTRIKYVLDNQKIEVLDPPAKPQEPREEKLIKKLLPSLLMLVSSAIMAYFMGPMMLIFSGVSAITGIITAVTSKGDSKKEFEIESAKRIEKYNDYIIGKRKEIEKARKNELDLLNKVYIDEDEEISNFDTFSYNLFDRLITDEDFLDVRIGNGSVKALKEVSFKKQEKLEIEDELQMIPQDLSEEYAYISNAPVSLDFKTINALGIYGSELSRYQMLKVMVVDICARQFQNDVELFFVGNEDMKNQIDIFRFLPHVYNTQLGLRNIVSSIDAKNVIFEYLYKQINQRIEQKSYEKRIVVFLGDDYGFNNHPLSKYVSIAKDLGITFVFFGNQKSSVGLGCDYLIEMHDDYTAKLINASDYTLSRDFNFKNIPDEELDKIIKLLAPVYTEEISLEGTLTKNISMFQMLNILAVDDLDLAKRWENSDISKSMAAPIGVTKAGLIDLDLHDKHDGPHGLVAGTTGSGKSEILQTYILSMATLYHPYEVGFVIIDFKGGGMVNQFRNLPHLMGAITNIDGKEIDRSLKSIKAELQKRQRYFADADVNHISKYIAKYKSGEVKNPLPHLIIIVDEFAELKAEQPEFMNELISAARIGRSLGVHLILATQKPSGQVNEQIWSNSRFKLCLKVQNASDSNEVIKSPLAAEIKEAGRAYLQVGNNEKFELLQSAYSGASEKVDDSNIKEFDIGEVSNFGRRKQVFSQRKPKGAENDLTQLDAIVNYVDRYCETNNISRLPNICMPPLPTIYHYQFIENAKSTNLYVNIGLLDDPDHQNQRNISIDVSTNNTLIIGSSQTGKTNLIQTIIRDLSSHYTSTELNMYILDFGSMILRNFSNLHHVGGVVCASDDEKLKSLFRLLNEEIEIRKNILNDFGVSSFISYKEAGKTDLSQIVVFIDNFTSLKEMYLSEDDILVKLLRDGPAVGITFVMSNSQTNGIGYRYLNNFDSRIALYCNESSEYGTLFESGRVRLPNIAGRILLDVDKEIFECQTFIAFEGLKEFERVQAIKEFVENTNKCNLQKAKRIPEIPSEFNEQYILDNYPDMLSNKEVVIGVNYANVLPVTYDLDSMNMLAFLGRKDLSKVQFIKAMLNQIIDQSNAELYISDNFDDEFVDFETNSSTSFYANDSDSLVSMIEEIYQISKSRYDRMVSKEIRNLDNESRIILLINNLDAIDTLASNKTQLQNFKELLGKLSNTKVFVMFGNIENKQIPYSANDIYKLIKDTRRYVIFEDISSIKITDISISTAKKFAKQLEYGDAYFIDDTSLIKIKGLI